jgi:hypothetical protein
MSKRKLAPFKGREQGRADSAPDLCSTLPARLRALLLRDPAIVIGLCLRPQGQSAAGGAAMRALLDAHAETSPAARAALDLIARREERSNGG